MLNAQPLWDWINERHAIYIRKELRAGADVPDLHIPDPDGNVRYDLEAADPLMFAASPEGHHYSGDLIFQTYRFCNVFRELDRVTVWIRKNIREPFEDHEHLWFMLCIARILNWPPTLQELMETEGAWPSHAGFKPENMTTVLDNRKARGDKVYTGAYMIRAESKSHPFGHWTKQRYVAEIVLGRLWDDRDIWHHNVEGLDQDEGANPLNWQPGLQEIWEIFQHSEYRGWGPFMAYEVVTDLRHTRYLNEAADIMDWANAGPGAKRGLNRLQGRELKQPMSQMQANDEMYMLLSLSKLPGNLAPWVPPLEMRDIEHSLCETDKYLRVKLKQGRPRAKYVQGRGY